MSTYHISTESLTNGELVALGAIEITSIPHISIIDERQGAIADVVEKYKAVEEEETRDGEEERHGKGREILAEPGGPQVEPGRGRSLPYRTVDVDEHDEKGKGKAEGGDIVHGGTLHARRRQGVCAQGARVGSCNGDKIEMRLQSHVPRASLQSVTS